MRIDSLPANGGGGRVQGDAEELRIAISNVLDNAVKYSIREIDIRAELLAQDANVLLRSLDRGVGIPASELKRIFRRFYRVPLRTAMNIKGTGLGLFLVKSIARRHGGDAFAESEGLGKGATIIIRLPRIDRMSRILIVEDEANLARGLCFNFEAEGHQVTMVENGEDALDPYRAPAAGLRRGGARRDASRPRRILRGSRAYASAASSSPFLCSPPADARKTCSRDSRPAPMTICPSPSSLPFCWPACAACCAAPSG